MTQSVQTTIELIPSESTASKPDSTNFLENCSTNVIAAWDGAPIEHPNGTEMLPHGQTIIFRS